MITKKKFLRLENSPLPHNFCNGPSIKLPTTAADVTETMLIERNKSVPFFMQILRKNFLLFCQPDMAALSGGGRPTIQTTHCKIKATPLITELEPSLKWKCQQWKTLPFSVFMLFVLYTNFPTICHLLFLLLATYSTFKYLLLFNGLLLLKMYVGTYETSS